MFIAIVLVWPGFRGFIVEAKQKRVMAGLRQWGTAVEHYAKDNGSLPANSGRIDEVLFPLLVPRYVQQEFRFDYWGQPIEYAVSPDGARYQIISRGWKGEPDFPPGWIDIEPETTSCYEDDMIFESGEFVRLPEGSQKACTLGSWSGFWTIPQHPASAQAEISAQD